MIRWTGLAPWGFEFPSPGSLPSTVLGQEELHPTRMLHLQREWSTYGGPLVTFYVARGISQLGLPGASAVLLMGISFPPDTRVYEPHIRTRFGNTAHFWKVVALDPQTWNKITDFNAHDFDWMFT